MFLLNATFHIGPLKKNHLKFRQIQIVTMCNPKIHHGIYGLLQVTEVWWKHFFWKASSCDCYVNVTSTMLSSQCPPTLGCTFLVCNQIAMHAHIGLSCAFALLAISHLCINKSCLFYYINAESLLCCHITRVSQVLTWFHPYFRISLPQNIPLSCDFACKLLA